VNVLVIGSGMFVTGRGTAGLGTVLPALATLRRRGLVDRVTVTGTRADGAALVHAAAARLEERLGAGLHVDYRVADLDVRGSLGGHDCAIVSVPDHLHHAIGRQVLEGGLHCLMVKPLTPTLAEAKELAAVARARRLHAAVELHKRFDPSNLLAKRTIAEGRLGRPRYITVEYSQQIDIPRRVFAGWAHRTTIFTYLGVHYVDVVRFVTGYEPVRVVATGTRGVLAAQGVDTWDSIHAMTIWRDPAAPDQELVAQLAVGWIDPARTTSVSEQRIVFVGSAGRLDCEQKRRGNELVTDADGPRSVNPYFSELLPDADGRLELTGYGFDSIARFIEDVRDVRAGSVRPDDLVGRRPTFEDALPATAVTEAVDRSLASGRWEEVSR
jgi:predicted dehydrogenase